MKPVIASFLIFALFMAPLVPPSARAEDSVSIWGNYYKERSTRVISPMIRLQKDLPYDINVEVMYLVDQITSASGAFTLTDEVFQEHRNEVGAAVHVRLFDMLTPGITARYSTEDDYNSLSLGADIALELFRGSASLKARFERQHDTVRHRNQAGFEDKLDTTMLKIGYTHAVLPQLLVGGSIETQILSGYTENPYRVEQHPRNRNRYAAAAFAAYRLESTRTTFRLDYRFYFDTWELTGHTFGVEVMQRLLPSLEIAPRFRLHTQSEVFFAQLADCSGFFPDVDASTARCVTRDPKLLAFGTRSYGLRAIWTQSWLEKSLLEPFARSTIEPSYTFYDQDNAYGAAHIVQLGWYWPF